MSDNEEPSKAAPSGVWMTLGGEEDGPSEIPRRIDEDLPWVLDEARLANWSDDELYNLEVSFREWLHKAMKNTSWKVPHRKGNWNVGCKMTFDKVRDQFNIVPHTHLTRLLGKLCRHYALKANVTKGGIKIRGKRHSDIGYYFPRTEGKIKHPYSLRLKFELMLEEGKVVTKLNELMVPREKSAIAMDATRKQQNRKQAEYYQRWKEKYGGKYEYPTRSSSNEDTNS